MKKNYKFIILIAIIGLAVLFSSKIKSQVRIQIKSPTPGQLNAEDIYNAISLNNPTDNTYQVYLLTTVNEEIVVLVSNATSNFFELLPGFKYIDESGIQPFKLNYTNNNYYKIITKTVSFPEENYTICIKIINAENEISLG